MLGSLHKRVQYILNNPGKALTLGLTSQVLASSALNFQDPSSVRNANLTQKLHLTNPLLNDSLTLIAQRALPTLNLTWLNQTDINQMELVPEAWLNTNDTFLNKNLHRTKRDDEPHLEKEDAITNCVTAIRCGDLKQVKESWRDIVTLDRSMATLRKIIGDAYGGNVCNFNKVDSFIFEVLGSFGSKLIAYEKLILEMRKNNQLFTSESLRLAYRFDQVMNYPGFEITPEIESFCESAKSKLPQAVNYLLHNRVCLRSVAQNNEYLYASWLKRSNKMEKHVFTWIPSEYAGEEAVWRFESSDNGKTFYIYNPKQNAYLYAMDDKYNADRRNVVVQPIQGLLGSRWQIQLVAMESEIILWNDYYGETLYAASIKYNDHRRYAFTWVKDSVPSARWKLEDCGLYTRERRDISDDGLENTDLTLNIKQVGLENVGASINSTTVTLLDKPVTNLLFFQIKQPSNGNNKTLEKSIADSNRETIEESTSSLFNRTASVS